MKRMIEFGNTSEEALQDYVELEWLKNADQVHEQLDAMPWNQRSHPSELIPYAPEFY